MTLKKHMFEELRFAMPWGHVAAKAWGSPKGKPVLTVHGLLDNAGSFDRLIRLLPDTFYFVCIDLPGHGLSSHFPPGLAIDYFNLVLVIRRILDVLEWKSCIYMGHSLGAHTGVFFASLYPGRLEKVVALDGLLPISVSNENLANRICIMHDNAMMEPSLRTYSKEELLYAFTFMRMSTLNSAAAEALLPRAVTKVGDKYRYNRDSRFKIIIHPLMNFDQQLTLLRRLNTDTFVILADSGWFSVPQLSRIKKLILESVPKLSTITVEGNHDVHNNYPERVAPHIIKYLNNCKSNL